MTDVHDAAGEGAGAPAVPNRASTSERRGSVTDSGSSITVTQIRSGYGTKPKTRGTLRALGLGRIGRSNTLPDRPEIRGMIARVPHLVSVKDSSDETTRPGRVVQRRRPGSARGGSSRFEGRRRNES